jgi:hypothetical protein
MKSGHHLNISEDMDTNAVQGSSLAPSPSYLVQHAVGHEEDEEYSAYLAHKAKKERKAKRKAKRELEQLRVD